MVRFLDGSLRLNERAADDIFSGWTSPSRYEPPSNVENTFKFFFELKGPVGGNKSDWNHLALLCRCCALRQICFSHMWARDDHYPVCRLDIRQDSEFATGYGYPRTAFKREPNTESYIRNTFIDIFRIQTFWKVAHCTIIHLLSSEAYFKPSVPWLPVCLWCNLCTVV